MPYHIAAFCSLQYVENELKVGGLTMLLAIGFVLSISELKPAFKSFAKEPILKTFLTVEYHGREPDAYARPLLPPFGDHHAKSPRRLPP